MPSIEILHLTKLPGCFVDHHLDHHANNVKSALHVQLPSHSTAMHAIRRNTAAYKAAGCCRHSSVSRRLFRQAVAVATAHREGLVAAGGVKTLLVWAHQEKKSGHLARVSRSYHGLS